MTNTSVFSIQMASVKRLIAASLAVIGLAVGIGATPANALGVVVTDEPIVIDVAGLVVVLDLPAGAELTSEEIIGLYDAIVGGSVMDFKENIEELLTEDRIQLLEYLEDLIQFTILPFLERALDKLAGLVVTLKLNVETFVASLVPENVCVTTQVKRVGSTCVTVG